jgi:hypothetical protein
MNWDKEGDRRSEVRLLKQCHFRLFAQVDAIEKRTNSYGQSRAYNLLFGNDTRFERNGKCTKGATPQLLS